MFAHQYKLDNLCVIIDNNNLQIDGKITDVMSPYPIPEKLRAFGFQVREIDGHDFEQMESAFDEARATKGVPFAIIMDHHQGQGGLLHGGRGRLARQGPQRRGVQDRHGRAESPPGRSGGDVRWQM